MKHSKFTTLLLTAVVSITILSCSKKETPKPAADPSVTGSGVVGGYWFGSAYGGTFNQSFLFYNNGTVKVYDFYANPTSRDTTQAYDGKGTWTYDTGTQVITVNTNFPNGQTFSSTALVSTTASPNTMTFSSANSGYNGDVYVKQ